MTQASEELLPICAKLRAKRVTNVDFGHEEYVNPDGPEAAAVIEKLAEALERLVEQASWYSLTELLDEIADARAALHLTASGTPDTPEPAPSRQR